MGMDEMLGMYTNDLPRYMAETSAASDGAALKTRGLLGSGYVATAMGWRRVDALAAGDSVLTFDNGVRRVVEVRRDSFWIADMMAPASYSTIMVPAGALGNSLALELLPDQGVMIECDAACDAHGDPFAIVPAKALEGYRGITRISPPSRVEVFTLVFEEAQVVYTQGGALVHCPQAQVRLSDLGMQDGVYSVEPLREAQFLVECMIVEDEIGQAA